MLDAYQQRRLAAICAATYAGLQGINGDTERKMIKNQCEKCFRWLKSTHGEHITKNMGSRAMKAYQQAIDNMTVELKNRGLSACQYMYIVWWHLNEAKLKFKPTSLRSWNFLESTLMTLCKQMSGGTFEELWGDNYKICLDLDYIFWS